MVIEPASNAERSISLLTHLIDTDSRMAQKSDTNGSIAKLAGLMERGPAAFFPLVDPVDVNCGVDLEDFPQNMNPPISNRKEHGRGVEGERVQIGKVFLSR